MNFIKSLAEIERDHILDTLRLLDGNRTRTAKALRISIRCLRNRLKLYGVISNPDREVISMVEVYECLIANRFDNQCASADLGINTDKLIRTKRLMKSCGYKFPQINGFISNDRLSRIIDHFLKELVDEGWDVEKITNSY